MIWLGFVAKGLYQKNIGHLLSPNINWVAAISFYFIFILGILVFAVVPGLEKDSIIKTILMAALFGFFTYATYDLTNLATMKDWPLSISLIDMIWGMVLCSIVATCSFYIGKWLA